MGYNKAGIILDTWDIRIIEEIVKKDGITVGEIRDKLNITHANLIPHIKRLIAIKIIFKEKKQQTHHLKINKDYSRYMPFLKEIKMNLLKSEIKDMQRFKEKLNKK